MSEGRSLLDPKVSVFPMHQVGPWLRTEKDLRDQLPVFLPLGSIVAYVSWGQGGIWVTGRRGGVIGCFY